jgi:hypothetical protein
MHSNSKKLQNMKTTLLAMVAVAAGVATSNVYSASETVTFPIGYSFQSNPLDNATDNYANHAIPNVGAQGGTYSGPLDASNLQIWTGIGWHVVYFDSETSDTTTGFVDGAGFPTPAPLLAPGLGYLIYNMEGVAVTITYTGTIRPASALTYPTSARVYAVGSVHPLAGGVSTVLLLSNPNTIQGGSYAGPLDGSELEFLRVDSRGQFLGYKVVLFDSETTDTTTGFIDINTSAPVPEPQIPLGGGFFLYQQNPATYTWVQP